MNVLDVDVERRRAHGVDDHNVNIAVVPPDDARAVFLAKIDLPLTDHGGSPRPLWADLIYHTSITGRRPVQPGPGTRLVPSITRTPALSRRASSGFPATIISARST